MMSTIARLQIWYAAECNGRWEHSYGVKIDSLDNPGWLVAIDLSETYLFEAPFTPVTRGDSEEDTGWIHCKSDGTTFSAACGPFNLEEALQIFLDWSEDQRKPGGA